jgi:hypothetical protein
MGGQDPNAWMYGICTQHVYTGSGHHENYDALKDTGSVDADSVEDARYMSKESRAKEDVSSSAHASTPDYASHEEGYNPVPVSRRTQALLMLHEGSALSMQTLQLMR